MSDKLEIRMIPEATKTKLKEIAQKKYGTNNVSCLVRLLIDECIKNNDKYNSNIEFSAETKSIELILPVSVINAFDELSEQRLSTRNHYISTILYDHLGNRQLQGDEIETLRRSNYELTKIGANINQIAKAFNLIVLAGGGKVPEIGKKMAALSVEVKDHTRKVLAVLNSGTVTWGGKMRGGKKRK